MTVAPAGTVLCHRDDVREGEARGFLPAPDAPWRVIVVCRNGRFHGWLDSCPHYPGGTPMAWRKDGYLDGTGTRLACHAHGALFDIETGTCVLGPPLGARLTAVPLLLDPSGQVMLADAVG